MFFEIVLSHLNMIQPGQRLYVIVSSEKSTYNWNNLNFFLYLKLVQYGHKLLRPRLIELRGLDSKSLVAYGLGGDNLFRFIVDR